MIQISVFLQYNQINIIGRMAQASDAIILIGIMGAWKVYGAIEDISGYQMMTRGKVDGDRSLYVVYREPQYQEKFGCSIQ